MKTSPDPGVAGIRTPCIKVCLVEGESGLCVGCLRTLPEIAAWSRLAPEAREAVMAELESRRSRLRKGFTA